MGRSQKNNKSAVDKLGAYAVEMELDGGDNVLRKGCYFRGSGGVFLAGGEMDLLLNLEEQSLLRSVVINQMPMQCVGLCKTKTFAMKN